jgi:5-carboxymethyl-2-hydroxymuconate isomerase
MLGWLKSSILRRSPELKASDVSRIIADYGELLEKYPAAYMDESWLPVPKKKMRVVFKAAWKMAPTAEMRNYVEVAWTLLSMFQPGVGRIPVDAAERDGTPESLKMLHEYLKLSERSKAESDRDYAEMREFTRANVASEPRLPRSA